MRYGAAHNRVYSSSLGSGPALGRRHLVRVTPQELSERRLLGNACISDPARPISFRFQISCPAVGIGPLVKRLRPRRNSATTHLRLPASSQFSNGRHAGRSDQLVLSIEGRRRHGAKQFPRAELQRFGCAARVPLPSHSRDRQLEMPAGSKGSDAPHVPMGIGRVAVSRQRALWHETSEDEHLIRNLSMLFVKSMA